MPHTVPAFTCSHMRPQPCTHHTMPHTIHAFTYMFIHAIPTHSVCFFLLGASVMPPLQALPARARCRGPAALGDVLLKEAKKNGKSFLRYATEGRKSPIDRQKMTKAKTLLKGMKKAMDTMSFKKSDFLEQVEKVWEACHESWGLKKQHKNKWCNDMYARVYTLAVHANVIQNRPNSTNWYEQLFDDTDTIEVNSSPEAKNKKKKKADKSEESDAEPHPKNKKRKRKADKSEESEESDAEPEPKRKKRKPKGNKAESLWDQRRWDSYGSEHEGEENEDDKKNVASKL